MAEEVCRFYLQGRCKFGDNCRHYHPPGAEGSQSQKSAFPRSDNSAFGSSGGGGGFGDGGANKGSWDGGGGGNGHRDGQRQGGGGRYKPRNRDGMHADDQPQKPPVWPLTAIGKKDLSAGNVVDDEYSPDELRVQAYMLAPRGQSAEVNQREMQLVQEHKTKEAAALGQMPIATSDPFALNGNGGGGGGGWGGGGEHAMNDSQQNDPFSSAPNGGGTFGRSAGNVAMSSGGDPFGGGAGNGHAPPSTFGGGTSASPFGGGGGNAASSLFGGAAAAAPMATRTPAPMPFAGNGNQGFAPQPPAPANVTKQESSLAEHEVKAFNAQSFGFDPIPETAPPARFC